MFRRLLAEEGETWDTVEVQKADPPSDEVLGSYDVRQLALRTKAWVPKPVVRRCQALRLGVALHMPAAGRATCTRRYTSCRQ